MLHFLHSAPETVGKCHRDRRDRPEAVPETVGKYRRDRAFARIRSYLDYLTLKIEECTVSTVITNGLYNGLYDGLYGLYSIYQRSLG